MAKNTYYRKRNDVLSNHVDLLCNSTVNSDGASGSG